MIAAATLKEQKATQKPKHIYYFQFDNYKSGQYRKVT